MGERQYIRLNDEKYKFRESSVNTDRSFNAVVKLN